ncbi:MAG TPA: hypothetical protein VGA13_12955 [Acidimicrobiales bacterium]
MAFGQQSGPPASHRQVTQLLQLLNEAGHAGFRDARGPMGFTQRQAAGKFTRHEAEAFIDQLENEQFIAGRPAAEPAGPPPRLTAADRKVADLSDQQLAAELQRRGWIVVEPH